MDEFEEFVNAGEVEIGKPEGAEDTAAQPGDKKGGGSGKPPKEAPTQVAPKTPAAGADDTAGKGENEDGADDEDGDGEEDDNKPKKTPQEHQIERLKREKRDLQRQLREGVNSTLERRLAEIETRLTGGNADDTKTAGKAAPDPSDTTKYPLGHLDDRYIEDKLAWLADQRAAAQADTALQRQQEIERNAAALETQRDILSKVDALATKGADLIPDFQEEVVETGMRGDWDLSQPTFEACHDADNGAQILYNLSQDPKEATRVAKLSPYQQLKYVQEKDAEISAKAKPNKKPQADPPPNNTARGANSKTQGNPATDDLDDFERQWERDAKGKR